MLGQTFINFKGKTITRKERKEKTKKLIFGRNKNNVLWNRYY